MGLSSACADPAAAFQYSFERLTKKLNGPCALLLYSSKNSVFFSTEDRGDRLGWKPAGHISVQRLIKY
jgi:hypothetical protein